MSEPSNPFIFESSVAFIIPLSKASWLESVSGLYVPATPAAYILEIALCTSASTSEIPASGEKSIVSIAMTSAAISAASSDTVKSISAVKAFRIAPSDAPTVFVTST